jgi:hypothetical protein
LFLTILLSVITLGVNGLFATLSLNDTQYNNTAIMLSVIRLSFTFNLMLC